MYRREFVASGLALGGLSMTQLAAGQDNFFVPPEENRHELTFMQWPVSRRVHPDPVFLGMLQQTIADIANTIAQFEPVVMLAAQSDHAKARESLSQGIELWNIPTEDLWARDSGPITVVDGHGNRAVRHIRFNGWGRKQVHKRDGLIAQTVAQTLDLPLLPSLLKGEAGGVEQDGPWSFGGA